MATKALRRGQRGEAKKRARRRPPLAALVVEMVNCLGQIVRKNRAHAVNDGEEGAFPVRERERERERGEAAWPGGKGGALPNGVDASLGRKGAIVRVQGGAIAGRKDIIAVDNLGQAGPGMGWESILFLSRLAEA